MAENSVFLKRPSRKDTDDDIEELQKLFLSGQLKPSVKVKKKKADGTKPSAPAKEGKDGTASFSPAHSRTGNNIPVLCDIVEKDVVTGFLPKFPAVHPRGFPDLPSASTSKENSLPFKSKKGKRSIFWQKMEASEKVKMPGSVPTDSHKSAQRETSKSYVIDGSGLGGKDWQTEAEEIHRENMSKLSSMSEEEILAHQKQLLEQISPELANFLMSRRRTQDTGHKKLSKKEKQDFEASEKNSLPVENEQQQRQKPIESGTSQVSGNIPWFTTAQKQSQSYPGEQTLKEFGTEEREGILLENLCQQQHANVRNKIPEEKTQNGMSQEVSCDADEDLHTDELPINLEEAKKWMHMDKVEKEKLRWMTALPERKNKSEQNARFDFSGRLVSGDDSISTRQGLHHHSNEPEEPGYSIEELYLLARSSVQSQRISALETLTCILRNYWDGCYDRCFDVPLLAAFLHSGLVPLLRWALDDVTVPSVAAAVLAINRLLVCSADEMCLDWTFCWLNGHISPLLTANDEESNVNMDELTDAALIKLDVIKGLVRMDIIPRFRYLLQMSCPSPSVCSVIIETCIRIARHSSKSAKELADPEGIIGTVFQKFLPVQWHGDYQSEHTQNYACPMACALKLVRVIASANRELAVQLLRNHHLMDSLKCYLTIDPSDKKLRTSDVANLMIESLRTWCVYLNYGLCMEIYLDLFPLLVKQFQFCQSISMANAASLDCIYVAHFLKVIETVVVASGDKDLCSKYVDIEVPDLTWNQLAPLWTLAEVCLHKWLAEFCKDMPSHLFQKLELTGVPVEAVNTCARMMLGSCLNCVAVFLKRLSAEVEYGLEYLHSCWEKLLPSYIFPFLESYNLSYCLASLCDSSALLYSGVSGCKRDVKVLTSLGCVTWRGDIVPAVRRESCFPITSAVAHLVSVIANLTPELGNELACILLKHSKIQKYIKEFLEKANPFCHWFDRFEIQFIFSLLELACTAAKSQEDKTQWYSVALHLIHCIRSPREWYGKVIMKNVIFSSHFLGSFADSTDLQTIGSLSLEDISEFYVNYFMSAESLEMSCNYLLGKPSGVNTLAFENIDDPCIGKGWPFIPIFNSYKKCKEKSSNKPSVAYLTNTVRVCLEWIHWCSMNCEAVLKDVSLEVKFTHLCMVFLIDGELFMVPEIRNLLSAAVRDVVHVKKFLKLECMKWKDLQCFDKMPFCCDVRQLLPASHQLLEIHGQAHERLFLHWLLYMDVTIFSELVEQFEAVSYGDHFFANFLAFLLQQSYPSRWRKLLLTENQQTVRFLNVPLKELMVPLNNYLDPLESDTELLQGYFKALISGLLTNKRCPLLFLMAVHHLHHFVCGPSSNEDFQKVLLKSLNKSKQQTIVNYILHYSQPNLNSELGFDVDDKQHTDCTGSE